MRVSFSVNDRHTELDIEPRTLLLDVLRNELGLTGTHAGCEQGVCGACTVLIDGVTVRSCLMFGIQATGRSITTIEGIGAPGALHPLQRAFSECHALQCGFCTPGMVLTALELLHDQESPTREQIEAGMSGSLCRCTGYVTIVDAIVAAAALPKVAHEAGR